MFNGKNERKALIVVIIGLIILLFFAFKMPSASKSIAVIISDTGNCNVEKMTGSGYKIKFNCNFSTANHCNSPLIVEFMDENPLYVSLDNWQYVSGTPECSLIESHDTYMKFECIAPQLVLDSCGTGFGVSYGTRMDWSADLNYLGCSYGTHAIGDKWCAYGKIHECIGNEQELGNYYAVTRTACGEGQACDNGECIDVDCLTDSDCGQDSCEMNYECIDYTCYQESLSLPEKPCEEAEWVDFNPNGGGCYWNETNCIPPPECLQSSDCGENDCHTEYYCINGKCSSVDLTIPVIPCTGAVWNGYPECQWDVAECIQPECTSVMDCPSIQCLGTTVYCIDGQCITEGECVECINSNDCQNEIPSDCVNGYWTCNANDCKLNCDGDVGPPNPPNLIELFIEWIQGILCNLFNWC